MRTDERVVSHWTALVDDFTTSGQDFFTAIEAKVQEREVPLVKFSRIKFHERGAFSGKREYLRVQRDDLIFDIGAAPFGTGFFFSWWLVQKEARYAWIYTVIFFLIAIIIPVSVMEDAGSLGFMVVAIAIGLVSGFVPLVLLGKAEFFGPETHISQAPLIGWLYERIVSPLTYHSQDLVAMYQESIRRAVNEAVDETLSGQGRPLLTEAQKALPGGTLELAPPGSRSASPEVVNRAGLTDSLV